MPAVESKEGLNLLALIVVRKLVTDHIYDWFWLRAVGYLVLAVGM